MPAEPMTDEQIEAMNERPRVTELKALKARMERGLAMRFMDGAVVERAIEYIAAVPALVAEVRRLRSALAECGRAGCPTAARAALPPAKKPGGG